MATNHTENYQLCLWEPEDKFVREEFNENNEKLEAALVNHDAALATKADTAALNALSKTVASKGNCRVITGSYVGTGTYGESQPNSLDFPDMGKAPVLLCVGQGGLSHFCAVNGIVSFMSAQGIDRAFNSQFVWTKTGVKWFSNQSAMQQLNTKDYRYHYCAFFD